MLASLGGRVLINLRLVTFVYNPSFGPSYFVSSLFIIHSHIFGPVRYYHFHSF